MFYHHGVFTHQLRNVLNEFSTAQLINKSSPEITDIFLSLALLNLCSTAG